MKVFELDDGPEGNEARKEEWRKIKRILDLYSWKDQLSKKTQRLHKECFFTGNIPYDPVRKRALFYAAPFFELWYHPEPSEALVKAIFAKQTGPEGLRASMDMLFNIPSQEGWDKFDPVYGIMGGREELAVKLLIPSYTPMEERSFPNSSYSYSMCPSAEWLAAKCFGATYDLLSENDSWRVIRNLPGQFLWDHVSINASGIGSYRKLLSNTIPMILDFYDRKGPHRENPASIALAETLRARFEARDFSETLMEYWDKAKAEYEAGKA